MFMNKIEIQYKNINDYFFIDLIQASSCSLVSDVKEQVEALLSIPVTDQKLIFKGKALMGKLIFLALTIII